MLLIFSIEYLYLKKMQKRNEFKFYKECSLLQKSKC